MNDPVLMPVPGTTGYPKWMGEPVMARKQEFSWNDLAASFAIAFHAAGLTASGVTDEQIRHTFHAFTGWLMQHDLEDSAMPEFGRQVRIIMAAAEVDCSENDLPMGAGRP